LVQTRDLEEAIELANDYAPEHLAILTEDATAVAENIRAAGAVFIGQWTPESMGDFVAGPSHVLPTGGSAKFFNGLTVDSFMRRTSILSYDEKAFAEEAASAGRIAASEGLEAHSRSINVRR
jgi:histidinol dehydrogenase